MMLAPAENHAEHSMVVAVYAVLQAAHYGADPAIVFLAGLNHHAHSAVTHDSGLTGEVLLGDLHERVIGTARERALFELPRPLQNRIREALVVIADDGSPEGRACHAADVIDLVLEIEQHLAAAHTTMDMVLRDNELIHAGPVEAFHKDNPLTHAELRRLREVIAPLEFDTVLTPFEFAPEVSRSVALAVLDEALTRPPGVKRIAR